MKTHKRNAHPMQPTIGDEQEEQLSNAETVMTVQSDTNKFATE